MGPTRLVARLSRDWAGNPPMGNLLNTSSVMMCPHGGTVSAASSNTKAKAGDFLLRPSDTFTIAGCTLNISGAPLMFKVHPAIVNVSDGRRRKSPAFAFVLLLAALTVPPCGHIMTLDVLSRFPIGGFPAQSLDNLATNLVGPISCKMGHRIPNAIC